ncbi:MAG: hypothetical protein OXT70_11455 [Chloroflexota bacterium]|nr:hypothetical protein [Chloroflexota bacterium]
MTLERALSLGPDAVVIEADEAHYRQQFEEMLCALEQVSDRVEGAELGIAYVGVDGTAEMNDELLHAVPARFRPHIGIGANKFTAFAAARVCRSSSVARISSDVTAFLAPHSIDLLPCPPELIDDLHLLGLHQMGEVATQDPNALLDRFGREGRRAWELCNGIDDRPLVPRVHEESIMETIALPSEAISMELLRVAVDTLLQRVFAQPRMQGRYAGLARLVCQLEDGSTWERTYHFKNGVGHWKRAAEIIKGRLETEHPQAPVEAVTITLAHLSGASGEQLSFFPELRADREQRLLEVERQLRARLNGKHSLHRLVEIAPWHPVPEMRVMQVPLGPAINDRMRPLTAPAAVAVREGPNQEPLAVRIGEQWREVARIEDRWSFDLWWRPTPIQRDYYRINQADGRQLTVFRDEREGCWYRQGGSA